MKIADLIKTGGTWTRAGFPVTPNEKQEERLAICASCEFYAQNRCKKCGCFMNLKTRLATATCPIGKW